MLQAALEAGRNARRPLPGPAQLEVDVDGTPFPVENYGGEAFGDLTLGDATKHSVNTVYAQLVAAVGPKAVVDAAKLDGIDADLDAVPSIALGAEEVSPLDLASAYSTFANDGSRVEPYAIARIEDGDGNLLWEPERRDPIQVVDTEIARTVTEALRGVIESGTGTAADIGRPAAGKTGTTTDNVDAWFAGYVPGYTAVVWMGFPEGGRPMDDVQGRSVTGGGFPAEIWQRFMSAAMDGRETGGLPGPAGGPPPAGSSSTSSTLQLVLDQQHQLVLHHQLVEHHLVDRADDDDHRTDDQLHRRGGSARQLGLRLTVGRRRQAPTRRSTSAGVAGPSWTTAPSRRAMQRSTRSTKLGSWVATTIALPLLRGARRGCRAGRPCPARRGRRRARRPSAGRTAAPRRARSTSSGAGRG